VDFHIEAQYRPKPMDFLCRVEAAEIFDVAGTQQVVRVAREGHCTAGPDLEKLKDEAEREVAETLRGLIEIRNQVLSWGGKIGILK